MNRDKSYPILVDMNCISSNELLDIEQRERYESAIDLKNELNCEYSGLPSVKSYEFNQIKK